VFCEATFPLRQAEQVEDDGTVLSSVEGKSDLFVGVESAVDDVKGLSNFVRERGRRCNDRAVVDKVVDTAAFGFPRGEVGGAGERR
jgi:hypothetical protein